MSERKPSLEETVCGSALCLTTHSLQSSILNMILELDSFSCSMSIFVRTFVWTPVSNSIQIGIRNSIKSNYE